MAKNLNAPEHWLAWLRVSMKDQSSPISARGGLGMLTGQDARTLGAIAAALNVYGAGDENAERGGFAAVVALLPSLQRKCWCFARELIAQQLDWHLRDPLWTKLLAAVEQAERSRVVGVGSELMRAGLSPENIVDDDGESD